MGAASSSTRKSEATPLKPKDVGADALDESGEVLDEGGEVPLNTASTFGLPICYMLMWFNRGAQIPMVYAVWQSYLHAPPNVTAASASLLPSPFLFFVIPGMLSDCVPLCGSRRRTWALLGVAICLCGYLSILVIPWPESYYCNEAIDEAIDETVGDETSSSADPAPSVCNPDAPSHAGVLTACMMLANLGIVVEDAGLSGLMVDYARREPVARRGRVASYFYLFAITGVAAGELYAGLSLSSADFGGEFGFGLSFPAFVGVCALLQAVAACLLVTSTYEPPLPESVARDWKGAARASLSQTADALRSPFVVRVLIFALLMETISYATPPSDIPAMQIWSHVTPFFLSLTSFLGSLVFAFFVSATVDVLPHLPWRTTLLLVELTAAAVLLLARVFIAHDVIRAPWWTFVTSFFAGASGITTLLRQIFESYVIVELTSGSNQSTIYALVHMFEGLGPSLARAIVEPIYGALRPSLALTSNYVDDTDEFRMTATYGALICAGFGCLVVTFIWLLPNTKAEAQAGMRQTTLRAWLLYAVVFSIAALMGFALTMTIAPLVPSLACEPLFGGGGCEQPPPMNGTTAVTTSGSAGGGGEAGGGAAGEFPNADALALTCLYSQSTCYAIIPTAIKHDWKAANISDIVAVNSTRAWARKRKPQSHSR